MRTDFCPARLFIYVISTDLNGAEGVGDSPDHDERLWVGE